MKEQLYLEQLDAADHKHQSLARSSLATSIFWSCLRRRAVQEAFEFQYSGVWTCHKLSPRNGGDHAPRPSH